jgi:hypothetical protein
MCQDFDTIVVAKKMASFKWKLAKTVLSIYQLLEGSKSILENIC